MSEISITVDGVAVNVAADQKPTQIFADKKDVVVCKINGELKDLWSDLVSGDSIESVTISSPEGLAVLRHSTAHVMAQAVQSIFSGTRLGIGPPITDGFYYDFDPERPFNPDDFEKIESAMRKIIKDGQRFKRRITSESDALKELAHEPYKCELIGLKSGAGEEASVEVGGAELTIYDNLGRDGQPVWSDLCRGPHLPSTKHIPAFKLISNLPLEIEAYVPEVSVVGIDVSDYTKIKFDAVSSDTGFDAVVSEVDPKETIKDGVTTYKIQVVLNQQTIIIPIFV
jgi:threonyl-tRNA synthetase